MTERKGVMHFFYAIGHSTRSIEAQEFCKWERTMNFQISPSLITEHEELHGALARATKAGGRTGDAAKAVAKLMHPHFVKEEESCTARSEDHGYLTFRRSSVTIGRLLAKADRL